MGRYEYATVSLCDEAYLEDAQQVLADVFDIAINVCGLAEQETVGAFLASGIAHQLERHNPAFVAGCSGTELVQLMLPFAGRWEEVEPVPRFDRTPDWWVGWALAYYQFARAASYRSIFSRVPYGEIRQLYHPLHEAPESKFVEVLERRLAQRQGPTKLKVQREAAGFSQTQLARASGVGLRSIQLYEQRQKDVDKAQAATLFKLSRALHCEVADLVESA